MFGLMFSSYVILISPIKFFSIMINHPKVIVSKIKDNLYLAVVFSPLLVIFTTPELVIFILTLLFNIIFFQRKRSHDNIFNRDYPPIMYDFSRQNNHIMRGLFYMQ